MPTKWGTDQVFEEGGAGTIGVSFEDEDGADETPTAIAWSLYDEDGDIVNSRTAVAIEVPATTNYITLNGTDLALPASAKPRRTLYVDATYDSTYGNGQHLIDTLEFMIKQVTGKP